MKYVKRFLIGLLAVGLWSAVALYAALEGVWMNSVVSDEDTSEFFNWAVDELEKKNAGSAALVLLENGEIAHQYFFGKQEGQKGIDENTLFPTASFSKWITALSIMSLVESKSIDLDTPVSNYLTRWQLPTTEFDNNQVTPRRLLSHTAGLTDGLGFGDYTANETLPTTEEALGSPRASSSEPVEISVGIEPGSQFKYSGGGYLILQLLVEEVTGLAFQDYVQNSILDRADMNRSSYDYLAALENVSPSFETSGAVAETFKYASPAATGLSSSVRDLSSLAKRLLANDGAVVSGDSLEAMRQPQGFVMGAGIWGLGTMLYAPTPGGDYAFGHDGANDPAINSTVRLNPETSDGIVLLVSGHPTLASNIGSEWVLWQTGYPDFLSTEKALGSAMLPILAGSFLIFALGFWWIRRQTEVK